MKVGNSVELRKETVIVPEGATTLYLNYYHKNIDSNGIMYAAIVTTIDFEGYGNEQHMMGIGENALDTARATVFEHNKDSMCLNFPFITDLHVNGYSSAAVRADYNIELFKKIADERWSDFAYIGGDLYTVTPTTTNEEYLSGVGKIMQTIGEIAIPTFIAKGNHDCNGKGSADEVITAIQWYLLTQKNTDSDVQITSANSGYFYHDFEKQKVRVIVLSAYQGSEEGALYGAQIDWFKSVALDFSDKTDKAYWQTLILIHNITTTTTAPFWRILTAFNNGTDDHDDDADYTEQGAMTVIGIIHGHTHTDESTTVNGINVIGTCNAYGSGSQIGTINEYAIDCFSIDTENRVIYATRIGRGVSRDWNY